MVLAQRRRRSAVVAVRADVTGQHAAFKPIKVLVAEIGRIDVLAQRCGDCSVSWWVPSGCADQDVPGSVNTVLLQPVRNWPFPH
jgi:hypothetical protein